MKKKNRGGDGRIKNYSIVRVESKRRRKTGRKNNRHRTRKGETKRQGDQGNKKDKPE